MLDLINRTVFRVLIIYALLVPDLGAANDVADEISRFLNSNGDAADSEVQISSLDATVLVPRFYQQRNFTPAWSQPESFEELFRELASGVDHLF